MRTQSSMINHIILRSSIIAWRALILINYTISLSWAGGHCTFIIHLFKLLHNHIVIDSSRQLVFILFIFLRVTCYGGISICFPNTCSDVLCFRHHLNVVNSLRWWNLVLNMSLLHILMNWKQAIGQLASNKCHFINTQIVYGTLRSNMF